MPTAVVALKNLLLNNFDLVLAFGAGVAFGPRSVQGLLALLPGGELGKRLRACEERKKEDRVGSLLSKQDQERQDYLRTIGELQGQIAALENLKNTNRDVGDNGNAEVGGLNTK